jgi:hypothetical protein
MRAPVTRGGIVPKLQKTVPPRSTGSRVQIINAVHGPLGFFVLVVLLVEVMLGVGASLSSGDDRTLMIRGMLALVFTLIAIVTLLAIFRPESLRGARPVQSSPAAPSLGPDVPSVLRISRPAVLLAAAQRYRTDIANDIRVVRKYAARLTVIEDLTAPMLRHVLSEGEFQIVHLLAFVEPSDERLKLGSDDTMSSDGLASLIELCKAQLVILGSCQSIGLAAKVSRLTNIIAATANLREDDFLLWEDCFFRLLFQGLPLSAAFEVARTTTDAPMVLLMKQDLRFVK